MSPLQKVPAVGVGSNSYITICPNQEIGERSTHCFLDRGLRTTDGTSLYYRKEWLPYFFIWAATKNRMNY
jgi:hypothetical protein